MSGKKIGGVILIIIAIFLTLAFLGQLPKIIALVANLLGISKGDSTDEQAGYLVGQMTALIIQIVITVLCWIYGLRLIRKKSN
jgi:hypothetical protein